MSKDRERVRCLDKISRSLEETFEILQKIHKIAKAYNRLLRELGWGMEVIEEDETLPRNQLGFRVRKCFKCAYIELFCCQ